MPDPANAVIALEAVSLRLMSRAGPVDILSDVSLDVQKGESLAIVGPSGSGKTSLLMLIAGLEKATNGRIEILGNGFGNLSEDALARIRGQHIGIVFQSFHLVPTMTALENVALPLEFADHDDPYGAAAQALEEVGLARRGEHFPAQLSGGEQQRVALARALAPGPSLLLADEPTGNLDARSGKSIMDLLFTLQRQRGATLVLVTHDLQLAARCGRQIAMQDGRIEAAAEPVAAS